jgi:hypothetical protein
VNTPPQLSLAERLASCVLQLPKGSQYISSRPRTVHRVRHHRLPSATGAVGHLTCRKALLHLFQDFQGLSIGAGRKPLTWMIRHRALSGREKERHAMPHLVLCNCRDFSSLGHLQHAAVSALFLYCKDCHSAKMPVLELHALLAHFVPGSRTGPPPLGRRFQGICGLLSTHTPGSPDINNTGASPTHGIHRGTLDATNA